MFVCVFVIKRERFANSGQRLFSLKGVSLRKMATEISICTFQKLHLCVCVYVYERKSVCMCVCVLETKSVCVCVLERERDRERERERNSKVRSKTLFNGG